MKDFVDFNFTVLQEPSATPSEEALLVACKIPGARARLLYLLQEAVRVKIHLPLEEVVHHHELSGRIKLLQYLLTGE